MQLAVSIGAEFLLVWAVLTIRVENIREKKLQKLFKYLF